MADPREVVPGVSNAQKGIIPVFRGPMDAEGLVVGPDGHVLTADSTSEFGVAWTEPEVSRENLPALADELGIGGSLAPGEVKVFATLADAKAWQANNPSAPEPVYLDGSTVEPAEPAPSTGDTDITGPTGATVAVSGVSATAFTVTVSGAVDVETGLHATAPYAFSKDGGTTWTTWQSSPTYTFSGLTASTDYPAPKVKVRNQSSTTDETVFTAASPVRTTSGVSFQTAVSDPAATFVWNMDESTGAALAQTGADIANATQIDVTANATVGGRTGLVGYTKAPDFGGLGVAAQATIKTGQVYNDLTAVTASAVLYLDGMTAYGAEAFSSGLMMLRINADRTLEGQIKVGHYSPLITLNPKSSALAASASELLGKPLVIHLRYSANPDECAVFFQGQKIATDTYAAALTRNNKTSAEVPNMTYAEPATTTAVQKFGGALDGAMNGARMWLGTALTDAEILSHAQAAGVA